VPPRLQFQVWEVFAFKTPAFKTIREPATISKRSTSYYTPVQAIDT